MLFRVSPLKGIAATRRRRTAESVDLVGAREKLERALEIKAKVYGTRDHYLTAMTGVNLGFLLLELEEAESGATLLAHAYGVFLKQLGPDHPYTRQLAPLFTQKGERGE